MPSEANKRRSIKTKIRRILEHLDPHEQVILLLEISAQVFPVDEAQCYCPKCLSASRGTASPSAKTIPQERTKNHG